MRFSAFSFWYRVLWRCPGASQSFPRCAPLRNRHARCGSAQLLPSSNENRKCCRDDRLWLRNESPSACNTFSSVIKRARSSTSELADISGPVIRSKSLYRAVRKLCLWARQSDAIRCSRLRAMAGISSARSRSVGIAIGTVLIRNKGRYGRPCSRSTASGLGVSQR